MFADFKLENFKIPEELLKSYRYQLYHSSQPGYIIIKNFINDNNVRHLRRMWLEVPPEYHEQFSGKDKIYLGCPNYFNKYSSNPEQSIYYNFLWNVPYDELTYNIALYVQMIRNLIEGKNFSNYIFPFLGQSICYRVTITRNGSNIVAPHRDYYEPANKASKYHDLTRLQGTLVLSKNGVDYEGSGFEFQANTGEKIKFDVDVPVNPGDLIIWRYSNLHSVGSIKSEADQIGFCRILFPPEFVLTDSSRKNNLYSMNNIKKAIPVPIKTFLKKILKGKANV